MMVLDRVGVLFPDSWQYGPMEHEIYNSTGDQIEKHFSHEKNLLINTTWFGPQFENNAWQQMMALFDSGEKYDNLFLLATIDPVYISEDQISSIMQMSGARKQYRIGMWEDSQYEWNWHAAAGLKISDYDEQDLILKNIEHVFLCYQRKPRRHRVEFTNLLLESGLASRGVFTLGTGSEKDKEDWSEGLQAPSFTVGDDLSQWQYADIGEDDFCAGLPNDVFTLGKLSIWQSCFLNIVSETEFNNWHPRFVTEKTWKPIVGMRPFIIHGQARIYPWLRSQGFRTFNHYWPHVDVETSEDQHGIVMSVLHWLCDMPVQDLEDMYQDMLSDLRYNRDRFLEFSREQYHKMHNLFQ